MIKVMELDIPLTPDDIVDCLVNSDTQFQSAVLRKLSKVHYRKIGSFDIQLRAITEDIKDSYDHDIQNNIKHMIDDIQEHICEVDE